MKKLAIGLAVLLSGAAVTAQASYPTGTSPCAVTVPSYCGGFTFGLTGLYWRASSPQRTFAASFLSSDDFDFAEEDISDVGDIHYHSLDHDFDWGFKANIGYIFPCSGNDVNLTYTHFSSHDNQTTNDFVLPTPAAGDLLDDPFSGPNFTAIVNGTTNATFAFPLSAILEHPDFELTDFSHQLSAQSEFKNHTWDLDFGQAINVGCNFNFRLFGGLRYSKLEHKLNTQNSFSVSGVVPSTSELNSIVFSNVELAIIDSNNNEVAPVGETVLGNVDFVFDETSTLGVDFDLTESFLRKSRFEGLGPRIGVDMNYRFCGGFGLVGSLSTSLLVGRNHNDEEQSLTLDGAISLSNDIILGSGVDFNDMSISGQIQEVNPSFSGSLERSFNRPEETRVVPNIDAKLGVNYSYQFCNCSHTKLTLEAGYQVSHYFSAIDRLGAVDGINVGAESDVQHTIDVSFDGPYVSVQVAL